MSLLRQLREAVRRLPRLQPDTWLVVALLVVIELGYVFIVSAGHMTKWPTYTTFLDDQAEGYRSGHLHMAVEPPEELVKKANPMDPANRGLWYWDASLYKGHYYIYWGPVPALLLAAFKTLLRIKSAVGDEVVVFALASVQAIAGAILLMRLRRRLFPGLPLQLLAMAVMVFGFVNPTLYNLGRGSIYEAAIVGGHAFLVAGLVFAFDAVWTSNTGPPARAKLRTKLILAGSCWALALASRISVLPAVTLLPLATAVFAAIAGGEQRLRRFVRAAFWQGVPLALGVFGLLLLNKLRFERWLEFGRDMQLSWIPTKLSATFVPGNAYSYLFRTLVMSCRFPFTTAPMGLGRAAYPKWVPLPTEYWSGSEQVVGLAASVPWFWLGAVAVVVAIRACRGAIRRRAPWDARTGAFVWATVVLAIAGSVTLATALTVILATMRYMGDVTGALALLGALGVWSAWVAVRERRALRWTVVGVCWLVAITTMIVGAGLGIEGQYKHFRLHNPALLDRLEQRFSVCAERRS
jgi:hypothetical protein